MKIVAADLVRDPYPIFSWLRHEAPVWQLPGENAYLVSTWSGSIWIHRLEELPLVVSPTNEGA